VAKKTSKKLSITMSRSGIGFPLDQKRTLKALGLRHVGQTREIADTPAVRGMISKVSHLVSMEEA